MEEFIALTKRLEEKVKNIEFPEESLHIIQTIYMQLAEVYKDYGIGGTMEQQISGELTQIKHWIYNSNKGRVEGQLGELRSILKSMQVKLEECEEIAKKGKETEEEIQLREKKNHGISKERISNIDMRTGEMTSRVVEALNSSLNAIRNNGNRMMFNRGFSNKRIEQIDAVIRYQIRRLVDHNKEKIYQPLKTQDQETLRGLLKEYDEYLEEKAVTNRRRFVKEYRANDEIIKNTEKIGETLKSRETTQERQETPIILDSDYII